jgi:preprotein translocase subunit SecE
MSFMKVLRRVVQFLREVRAELRKVVWPTRQETIMFTVVVISTVAAVSSIFWVLDTVFAELFKLLVG